ncbi:MAG: dihydrofolate reductase [Cryomorphaceae bacterium]|nr:dihydrofolate reductase [Cryomorphaceae bacterium]
MTVTIIAARAENNALGKNNDLVWDLPADMKFFKDTTRGHVVITGRKNYESIPERFRPLKNRTNVVITRNAAYDAKGAFVVTDLRKAIELARDKGETEAFVIGGGQIYALALRLDLVDKMYLTRVHGEFDADVFFPDFNEDHWDVTEVFRHEADVNHACGFTVFEYIRKR